MPPRYPLKAKWYDLHQGKDRFLVEDEGSPPVAPGIRVEALDPPTAFLTSVVQNLYIDRKL
ncbi:MAG: hypothetical protein AUK24_02165 [Syntrophaceae bacterium CG2_30_49_12]|nr:MAG: hypothetical protein AUK24_02165 [Syntrophaceae bacterium CG2_30_49_12]PIP05468.1 MAG: hypothetical protein COX52_11815 [Syntrophobacterales bacterium CG23_combo_of_CG06-09_8_20_14_all_48_27]PJA48449.1 MAG: hypothetical protein CO171_07320 [Syntrophobacterales bacterium CG_4_9_14_3_um_filter_49_8]PJC75392.1 MAG: hypothetical protein CO012_03420 [Syntrophobacterales bacterium CG_4_8_14_3_um_filter_49_14]